MELVKQTFSMHKIQSSFVRLKELLAETMESFGQSMPMMDGLSTRQYPKLLF